MNKLDSPYNERTLARSINQPNHHRDSISDLARWWVGVSGVLAVVWSSGGAQLSQVSHQSFPALREIETIGNHLLIGKGWGLTFPPLVEVYSGGRDDF